MLYQDEGLSLGKSGPLKRLISDYRVCIGVTDSPRSFLDFPALSVPTGIANGLPTGVQLLGRRFDEDTLLDAATIIEARAGTFTPINPR